MFNKLTSDCFTSFRRVYIGKGSMTMLATMTRDSKTLVLSSATLCRMTEIEMILSVLYHPRWPKQVQLLVAVANGFDKKNIANVNDPLAACLYFVLITKGNLSTTH